MSLPRSSLNRARHYKPGCVCLMTANVLVLYSKGKTNLQLQSKERTLIFIPIYSPSKQLQSEIKVGCTLFKAVEYLVGFLTSYPGGGWRYKIEQDSKDGWAPEASGFGMSCVLKLSTLMVLWWWHLLYKTLMKRYLESLHSSIHSFFHQVFSQCLLRARLFVGPRGTTGNKTQKSSCPARCSGTCS